MSVFYDISTALNTHLKDMISAPPIAWQNDGYEPTLKTLYIQPTNLPADTAVGALGGSNGTDENSGIYSVNIFAELGKGRKESEQMADTIADRFKRDTEITYNGRKVVIKGVSIKTGRQSGAWYQVPVDIEYHSFTARR